MLRETGAFDDGYFFYWEDVELGFRAREHGWALAVADGCRVVHDEGSTLGRWSAERWELLFRGMMRFLSARAPRPAAAMAVRLVVHTAVMLRHGRMPAIAGAWRALGPPRP
jgi:GT2 family glycosyltransferase